MFKRLFFVFCLFILEMCPPEVLEGEYLAKAPDSLNSLQYKLVPCIEFAFFYFY